jgi:molecular chaperone HscB
MTSKFNTNELNQILQKNCFAVFDLPLEYKIDNIILDNKYQILQKQLHPDKFINHSDSLLSIMVSAHVNNSYNLLQSPLLKAIELLHQHGVSFDLNINSELPEDFLMLQIELYEEIEDIKDNTDKLTEISNKLAMNIKKLEYNIGINFVVKNFSTIVSDTKKLAVFTKLVSVVNQKIEESW